MPFFSKPSLLKLQTCHTDLQTLFKEVIKHSDCTVLEGFRDEAAQNRAFALGRSQQKWPTSKHNKKPSTAVDVTPYPIDWNDRERIIFFAGLVQGIASKLRQEGKISHAVRWGGDWNSDNELKDNRFDDLVHYELI